MPNAEERQRYSYPGWKKYLKESTGKNLEYNEDYYKYLRGMSVIRDLEEHEQSFMEAYDYVVFDVRR